ncbi:6-phosphogluconolactonase [Dokdonella sp. MW10]|uniref:6-phosphogluconolactonase n=1 Tax=Dokdonella sp. MW10 TaxID=2992926 RepID=UPI003F80B193
MHEPSVPASVSWRRHDEADALASALAAAVAAALRAAIDARGRVSLALSGGTTPVRFFEALSREVLAWERVVVTLVDERWVPSGHERSNAALVRAHLLQREAVAARFVPLHRDAAEPEAALADVSRDLADLLPLDVVVLGMGLDGHTASYFPDGEGLEAALDAGTHAIVAAVRAPAAGEPRITLTLTVLASAREVHLHIEGEAKRAVFERDGDAGAVLPIHRVLGHLRVPLETWWCP